MAPAGDDIVRAHRAARRLALASVFEAEFGQRTAPAILERHLAESERDAEAASFARDLVSAAVRERESIDQLIGRLAPQYPVVQLARMDRSVLRLAIGEVLHSATPARVAIAEWVELARVYSGDPARRLVNGVLGRIARNPAAVATGPAVSEEEIAGSETGEPNPEEGVSGHDLRPS